MQNDKGVKVDLYIPVSEWCVCVRASSDSLPC
jgi:hypothetical protein